MSHSANQDLESDSDPKNWTVVQRADGRVYYLNEITTNWTWDKPDCLKSSIEKISIEPWKEYQAANGLMYYHNPLTNETTWEVPPEVNAKRKKYKSGSSRTRLDEESSTSIPTTSSKNRNSPAKEHSKRTKIIKALANGYGNYYNWLSLTEAFHLAKIDEKPTLLVIHKSWCGACKYLAPKFAHSNQIQELSKYFYFVNAGDDDEPRSQDNKFSPDGRYNPRILFYDPEGNLMKDIINEDNEDSPFKYFYSNEQSIVQSMKNCLKVLKRNSQ